MSVLAKKNKHTGFVEDFFYNQQNSNMSKITTSAGVFVFGLATTVLAVLGMFVAIAFILMGNLGVGSLIGGASFIARGLGEVIAMSTSKRILERTDEIMRLLSKAVVETVQSKYPVKVLPMSEEEMVKFAEEFAEMPAHERRMTIAFYADVDPKQKQIGSLVTKAEDEFVLLDGRGNEYATRKKEEVSADT